MRLMPERTRIERVLRIRGIMSPTLRHLLCTQLVITDVSLAFGLICGWFTWWPLSFGMGSAIALYSFWSLATTTPAILQEGAGKSHYSIVKFAVFNLRLALIAIVLYVFLVRLRMPVAPMVAGLSSVLASITLWSLSKVTQMIAMTFRNTREI